MLKNCTIINAELINAQELIYLNIDEKGLISKIDKMENFRPEKIGSKLLDLQGDILSLDGIDLQINGALGLAFPDLEIKDLPQLTEICQFLWKQGVGGFLPTLVTTSVTKIHQALRVIAQFMREQNSAQDRAEILGVHLEGPFLNQEKRGAHPPQHLLPLNLEQIKKVLGEYHHIIKIITLAPELDPSGETIPYLKNLGITVSLGHSQATAPQAEMAFRQGATMVTHAFNAMPSLHHREPGLLGKAIVEPQVFCGVIADGKHICPTMLQILCRAAQGDQGLFLVSDALAPLGLPDGIYPWDDREIIVKDGTAHLGDHTLAGTTLPLLQGVENLVQWDICSPKTAIALATESPRKAIAIENLKIGQKAHFLRWSWDCQENRLAWKRLD